MAIDVLKRVYAAFGKINSFWFKNTREVLNGSDEIMTALTDDVVSFQERVFNAICTFFLFLFLTSIFSQTNSLTVIPRKK